MFNERNMKLVVASDDKPTFVLELIFGEIGREY